MTTQHLCQVCSEVTGTTGAGIMLACGDASQTGVGASDDVSALMEELQFVVGEGPCVDAFRQDHPVLEPDLANPETVRWAGFAPSAIEAGVRAVFSLPLRIGELRFGSLSLYRDQAGPLDHERHGDALAMAEVASQAVLLSQADAATGTLAPQLANGTNMRSVVHQAAGMVSAQLDISVAEALIRLRAHAYGNDRQLVSVATEIVERRIRMT